MNSAISTVLSVTSLLLAMGQVLCLCVGVIVRIVFLQSLSRHIFSLQLSPRPGN